MVFTSATLLLPSPSAPLRRALEARLRHERGGGTARRRVRVSAWHTLLARDGCSRCSPTAAIADPKFPAAHRPHRRRGGAVVGGRQARAGAGPEGAGGEIHRPARDLHHALAAGLSDRGLRLPPRALLADRAKGQEQRRHPDRRAQRPQGAHRGRPRARAAAHRPDEQADRRERHPAGVPAQRFRRRHQGRRARHPRRAAGRCGGGQGARQEPPRNARREGTASCRWRSS